MEYDADDRSYWKIKAVRRAPKLPSPTKLDLTAIFGLAMKASYPINDKVVALE